MGKRKHVPRHNIPETIRKYIRERDKVCRLCGHVGDAINPLTIHHIIFDPVFHRELLEGKVNRNDADWLTLLCHNCHQAFHREFEQRN